MRRLIPGVVLAGIAALVASPVWAQDQNAAVSQAQASSVTGGGLRDETVGIKPQVGFLNFKDATGGATNRGAIGLAWDINFSRMVAGIANNIYAGISTGGMYSHIGDAGSNFFGSNPGVSSGFGGANLALFPADLKLGYNFNDHLRISAHGGGNILYASAPAALAPELGSRVANNWSIFPNAGADVDVGLGKNVALTLRPDWTFSPGVGFFTGTLEFGFALG